VTLTLTGRCLDNYGTLLRRVDWTLVGDAGPLANKLTIYCGDSDFYTTNNGATWIDRANTIQFRGDGATRNGQPSICPGNDYAITALGNGFAMIFLCEILEAGRNTGSGIVPAVTERGTYKQLYDRGRLQYGTQLHPELEWVVSVSLLHELFHAVMGDTSQYRPFLAIETARYRPGLSAITCQGPFG
jgi:hypothetical protein